MTTQAGIGMGTTFAIGDGASPTEAFTSLGEMTALTPPDLTRDSIDATSFGSAAATREFIPGLIDPGEADVTLNFTEAAFASLKAQMAIRKATNYKITYPLVGAQTTTGSTLVFAAFPTSVASTDPMDGKREITAKFKASGVVTYTPGS